MIQALFQVFLISHAVCWLCYMATRSSVDQWILRFALASQLIGFMGLCMAMAGVWPSVQSYLIDFSHYGYVVTLVSGMFLFSELHNRFLLLCLLVVTLATRMYFGRCLFDIASVFDFPDFVVDYNYVFVVMILYVLGGFFRPDMLLF